MHGPLISILVPVWNGAAHLAETLQSVVNQRMPESGGSIELIAADDGSTDASAKIAALFASRILRLEHGGISQACNAALASASGECVMFLDQDDLLVENALCILWDALLACPEGAVSGMAEDFISPELPPDEAARLRIRREPYYGLLTGCMLMRTELARRVGPFNEQYSAGQAVDWLMRLGRIAPCRRVGRITARRRIHFGNTSRILRDRQWKDYGQILRERMRGVKPDV